jgi:DNA-binding transcriptional ArsR family regulator
MLMDYPMVSALLKAMGHPTRLRILNLLRQSGCCVQELEKELGLRQSNVSQHLGILRSLDMVKVERRGHTVCYSLNEELVCPLLDTLATQNGTADDPPTA